VQLGAYSEGWREGKVRFMFVCHSLTEPLVAQDLAWRTKFEGTSK